MRNDFQYITNHLSPIRLSIPSFYVPICGVAQCWIIISRIILDDLKEPKEDTKGSHPGKQGFFGADTGHVEIKGQFWSNAIVPDGIVIFNELVSETERVYVSET
jgi:hypothetical protein